VELENGSAVALWSFPPYPVTLSYNWIDDAGTIIVFDGARSQILAPLAPGDRALYRVVIDAPERPGRHLLRAAVVQEGVRWFVDPHVVNEVWVDVTETTGRGSA
jgi:hypothetical protein